MRFDDEVVAGLSTPKAQEEFYDSAFNQSASFGVRVSKGGRKVFFLIYPVNGRRRRVTLGNYPLLSLEDARNEALHILRYGPGSEVPRTFGELLELFLRRHAEEKWSLKTRREYERMIEKELRPRFGSRRLADITRADVLLLVERIRLERKSPVMAERVGALLSAIFNFAAERSIVAENPAARLERVRPSTDDPAPPILTADNFQLLWSGCEKESPSVCACVRFLLLTGQKVSDVLKLRWDDIELEQWRIALAKGRSRLLPLSPQTQQLLRDLRRVSHGEFVFSATGARPLSQIRAALNRICASRGVSPAWTTLDIRRSIEYALRTLKVRPDVIEELLGRTSARLRFRPGPDYDYENDLRAAVNLWGKKLHEYTRPTKKPPAGAKIIPLFPE